MRYGMGPAISRVKVRNVFPLNLVAGNVASNRLITFTNDQNRYYRDGILKTANSGSLLQGDRYDGSSWNREGWTFKSEREGLIKDSRDLTTGNYLDVGSPIINTDEVGIDGVSNTACTIIDDDGASEEGRRQVVSIDNDSSTYIASRFIKKDNNESRFPLIYLRLSGGTVINQLIYFNTKTGAHQVRNGADVWTVEDKGDWWFVWGTITNNSTGNTIIDFRVYPAWTDTFGSDSPTTGTCITDQNQVEQALYPIYGDEIITGTSQVTRTSTRATIEGADFSEIWDNGGSLILKGRTPLGSGTQTLFSYDDGTANNRIYAERNSSNEIHVVVVNGGATVADLNLGTVANDTRFGIAMSFADDNIRASLDGGAVSSDTSATLPTIDTGRIAMNYANLNHWDSFLKVIQGTPRKDFIDSQLQNRASGWA